jgi:hypothetical protein
MPFFTAKLKIPFIMKKVTMYAASFFVVAAILTACAGEAKKDDAEPVEETVEANVEPNAEEATAEEGAPADSSVVEEEAAEGGEDADAAEMPAEEAADEASTDMEAN